jgi:heptosyltransferase-2
MTSRDIAARAGGPGTPILVFGYPAVGDFVRCHSLVRIVAERFPHRPIDVVTRNPAVELAAFMPEVREAIAEDFRHRRLDLGGRLALAGALRQRGYGTAFVIPSSYKAALVPFLSRIPERIGWVTEGQWPLINRPRFGMHKVPRMVDRLCMLGAPSGDSSAAAWPVPRLRIPPALQGRFDRLVREKSAGVPVVALAPGSSDLRKNWPIENYIKLVRHCVRRGCAVWIVGSKAEGALAAAIGEHAGVQDRTMDSVTTLALNIAAANVFVGNDSGPLHVAAAFGKPCVGIFGLSDPYYVAPINPGVQIPIADPSIARRSRDEVHGPGVEQVVVCLDRQLDGVATPLGDLVIAGDETERLREHSRRRALLS